MRPKFEHGEIVKHKLTKERVLVLENRISMDCRNVLVARMKDLTEKTFYEEELEPLTIKKI